MPRFYLSFKISKNNNILNLPDEVTRHIHVLRMCLGDVLTLFDGSGGEYEAILTNLGKRRASVRLLNFNSVEREVSYYITLVQILCSKEKMRWIIEKSVELGVSEIVILTSTRSIVKSDEIKSVRRHEHWSKIIVAACEQCGRNQIPSVFSKPLKLKDWIETRQMSKSMKLMFSPRGELSFLTLPDQAPNEEIILLIGPEGGLSISEEEIACNAGFKNISLGKRILRTETVSIAVLGALAARWQGW